MKKGIIIAACGGIIAGLFLELHNPIFSSILEAIDFLIRLISWILASIFSNYSVPGWLILVAGFSSIFGLLCICTVIYSTFQSQYEPEFLTYKEASIHGAKWLWTWN